MHIDPTLDRTGELQPHADIARPPFYGIHEDDIFQGIWSGHKTLSRTRKRVRRLANHLNSRVDETISQLKDKDNWGPEELPPTRDDIDHSVQWLRSFYRELVVPTRDISLLPRFSLSGSRKFGFYWNTETMSGILQRTEGSTKFIATFRHSSTGKKESRELELDFNEPWSEDWAWLRQKLRN